MEYRQYETFDRGDGGIKGPFLLIKSGKERQTQLLLSTEIILRPDYPNRNEPQ